MMPLIEKYLTKEIFKYFGIVLLTVVGIYLAVDFFQRIDDFLEADLPFSKIIRFYQLKIPSVIVQIAPVGILLAVSIVFGLMNKNNEIIALKSSGVGITYLLGPVVLIGLLLSLLIFLLSELIVPITISDANRIWNTEVKKKSAVTSKGNNIWIKGNRFICHIIYYNPANSTILGGTLNFFDNDFRLTRRVDAKKGVFENGKWIFYDIMEQKLDKKSNHYRVTFLEEREEPFDFLPEDIKRVVKKSEEMGFLELYAYIKNIENEGYDASVYKVDLYAKLAFPLVSFIMCLAGAGISSRSKLKGSLSVSIFYGICGAFLYWIFYSFCLSLGYGEMLPPFMAAWAANLVFLCFAILVFLK
ncbi:MAG: lipopolysaccharide export system permease protein [Desulfobacteraceae bacterium Eth-SRB2]|nr:MAG: lipopolysaccharide export system permease protein [Desulfobacteraceae bacterium Eth-SRB2]